MGRTAWRMAPGQWVRLRHSTKVLGTYGRIIDVDGSGPNALITIETDACRDVTVERSDFRIIRDRQCPHDHFPMRKRLPYGSYILPNGSRVAFNRDMQPIRNHTERFQYDRIEFVYGADTSNPPPWRCEKTLAICLAMMHDL